jgi:predicted Zn-dependent protease
LDRGFNFYDNFPEHVKSKSRWGRIERRGMDVAQRTEPIALEFSQALERNGDLRGARDMLETSLKSHPDQFSARLRLGRIYLRSNGAQSAVVQFEAALLMPPESVEATVDLAKALIAGELYGRGEDTA